MTVFQSPEQVLRDRLASDPQAALLLGFRVFPLLAPATTAMPFAVYRRASIDRQQTMAGPLGNPHISMEIEIYDITYQGARNAADCIRRSLDGFSGTAYGISINRASLTDESDGLAQVEGGEVPPVYQISQTYDVFWSEE